jgi:hypothetical protein
VTKTGRRKTDEILDLSVDSGTQLRRRYIIFCRTGLVGLKMRQPFIIRLSPNFPMGEFLVSLFLATLLRRWKKWLDFLLLFFPRKIRLRLSVSGLWTVVSFFLPPFSKNSTLIDVRIQNDLQLFTRAFLPSA